MLEYKENKVRQVMNSNYDVKKLIKYIKALPIAIALIFSMITTYLVLNNSIDKHKENIQSIKSDFIIKQKILIKKEVMRTVKQIAYQKNLAETNLKKDIKTRVLSVHKIIENLYNENPDKSEKEITKLIKDALRTIRFNEGRGYFFIYTLEGKNILFPTSPELEGKNMWNLQDSKGGYSIRKLSKIAKEDGEGFLSWYWYKPSKDKLEEKIMHKKIGYIKYVKELNWFVGTGEYIENFENKIKTELLDEIQEIRYGKNGYIFINQYDGLILTNINKKLVGKNNYNIENVEGTFPLQNIVQLAKSGGGYLEYLSNENGLKDKAEKKMSYIYGFDTWQWQIGAGTYINDIDEVLVKKELEFKEKFYKSIVSIIISSVLLTLVLILITLKLLRIIEKEFAKYEESLSNHILENHKKDKLLTEQSKLAAMGEMLANISHQWRQPLSVISTAATGMKLQKEYDCLSDTIFNNTCDAINNNAQYLSKTIDDFKNFIQGSHQRKIFNLTKIIESFLNLVDSSIKTHNIDVSINLDDSININGLENELIQCIMNIFNNSKDALIENVDENRKVLIRTYSNDKYVVIEMRDNAGGIEEDILNKIFEPYFTTKHKSQGTGLGLHMTYNLIVDGMNGHITVQNDKEFGGALFTIQLPLK